MQLVNKFSTSKKYLVLSTFFGDKVRHGGVKRTDQIIEIFSNYDVIVANPYLPLKKSIKLSIKSPLIFIESLFYSIFGFLRGLSLRGSFLFSFKAIEIIKVIKANKDREIILEGAGNLPIIVMDYLVSKNLKFNTILGNIECFVPDENIKNYFKSFKDQYFFELHGYKNAQYIYTISDLDSVILGCHNIHSEIIPYYPSKKDYKKLREIRTIRNKRFLSENYGHILLLGTASNPPTRQGMLNAIRSFENQNIKYILKVAGFGTDVFNNLNSPKITIVGSVTDNELKELMQDAKCLIVNQSQTTGFLCKIVEFNLANIPILITSKYYQGYHLEKHGIFKVDFRDIPKILNSSTFNKEHSYFKKPKF